MTRSVFLALAAALALGPATAAAAPPDEHGWYGGIKLGRGGLGLGAPGVERARPRRDLSFGYRFGAHFALEGRYADSPGARHEAAPGADALAGESRASAWALTGTGVAPLGENWRLYGTFGLTRARAGLDLRPASGAIAPASRLENGTGLVIGAGTVYEFTRRIIGRAGWDRYRFSGESQSNGRGEDVYSIGVGVRF